MAKPRMPMSPLRMRNPRFAMQPRKHFRGGHPPQGRGARSIAEQGLIESRMNDLGHDVDSPKVSRSRHELSGPPFREGHARDVMPGEDAGEEGGIAGEVFEEMAGSFDEVHGGAGSR
mmetsp:Transcript_16713/g.34989  ORF Transcript_16713/g.34989 Transcript_16713/m.34989 type:complete len:117 (-) Transcript_16713:625-975(-)